MVQNGKYQADKNNTRRNQKIRNLRIQDKIDIKYIFLKIKLTDSKKKDIQYY